MTHHFFGSSRSGRGRCDSWMLLLEGLILQARIVVMVVVMEGKVRWQRLVLREERLLHPWGGARGR